MSRKFILFVRNFLVLCLTAGVAKTAQAQRPLGTDVSSFQPSINWTTVKNGGVVFAWAKATQGTGYVNPDFTSQESGATSVGIYIGAYHYAQPSSDPNITGANSADSEAAHFWSVAGGYVKAGGGYLVPMLDWEDPAATNGAGFTVTQMSAWVNEWCNDVSNDAAAEGIIIRPVVYTGTFYSIPTSGGLGFPGLNTTVTNWPDWFAAYPNYQNAQTGNPGSSSTATFPWPSWNIWQYGDTNWSGGDSDVYNGTWQNFLQTFEIGGTNNAPYYVSAPTNVIVPIGSNATFFAQATGLAPTFQWSFNGKVISGATSSNYTVFNAQLTNAGAYTVTAGNSYGNVPAVAVLSVISPLTNGPNSALDPTNMINWWTGNGNSLDIYGITNATLFGNVSYTNGEVGNAFRFDGSHAFLSNNAAEIAPNWTACMWVYRQNASWASATLMGDQTYALKLEQFNTTREVGISHSGVADYLFSPVYSVPVNKWTHLAFVATTSTVTLYTNGVQEGTISATVNLPRTYIGADWFTTASGLYSDFMLGALNEIQVFPRALSAAEVKSIFNAGTSGLVRAPQFTSVTNNNNGQIQLNLIGMTGKPITINTSSDLVNWVQMGVVSNQFGATNYFDSDIFEPVKFYQAKQNH